MIIDAVALGYHPGSASPIVDLFDLVTFLPSLAVAARRLHDTDRTAWWLLLGLTGIGAIFLIVWFCFKGTDGPNRFGAIRDRRSSGFQEPDRLVAREQIEQGA